MIDIEVKEEDFPIVVQRYGIEGAKNIAYQMCLEQFGEITESHLYSCLANLESDLEE